MICPPATMNAWSTSTRRLVSGVKDLVREHHERLVVDLGHVRVPGAGHAGGVQLADLGSGTDDPRAGIIGLLGRATAALPAGVGEVRARMDAGYFAGHAARYCHEQDIRFAIGAKRTQAMWRAAAAIPEASWAEAVGMPGAQVAAGDYLPDWWPAHTTLLVRRVRYESDRISTDPRSRRRRTIPAGQLALALHGQVDHVYGYSFILTDLPVGTPQAAAATECWYRARARARHRRPQQRIQTRRRATPPALR